jgi:anti-sigma factor RsiW
MSKRLPIEIRERITALVDGQITSPDQRSSLESLLESDEDARLQHVVESGLVRMLHARRNRLREQIPVDVERRVRIAIANEVPAGTAARAWWWRLLQPSIAVPAVVLLIAVGVFMIVERSSTPSTAPLVARGPLVDLQVQSYANFEAILRGTLTVAVATQSEHELRRWFEQNGVTYDVQFPAIEATLVGGVVSTHEHKKFAHLVYSVGDHLVYMFEVDEESLAQRDVALDNTIIDGLAHGRWHWEERKDTGTLFIWKSNNVVCAAVSDLRTDELSALFDLQLL